MDIRRICVYCGSRPGEDPRLLPIARAVGSAIGKRGWGLVYGGSRAGLMGAVADGALEAGAEVIGVLPHGLDRREVAHTGLTEMRYCRTMHERKALFVELADAFVTIPGGIGTLDEMFETLTWAYLGIHRGPVGLLNPNGYYDGLLAFLERAVGDGLVSDAARDLLLVETNAAALFAPLTAYEPPDQGFLTPATSLNP